MELYEKGKQCKEASYFLRKQKEEAKNHALNCIAIALSNNQDKILEANQKDIQKAKENGKSEALIDRLSLNEKRLAAIIDGVKDVIRLVDPCHKIIKEWDRNGMHFIKRSVAIGVIGIIYEARPNVSVDAAILCLKSGNVCFLRGSKDAFESNKALVEAMRQGLKEAGFPKSCIDLVEDTSHESAKCFMQMNEYLDLLIPRGGANLIQNAIKNATVPIIETGTGNCHIYVDKDCDDNKVLPIIINGKTQRVSVCNAIESLLIHKEKIALLPSIIQELKKYDVIIHGCPICCQWDPSLLLANEEDYGKEYLNYEISIKVVDDLAEAIQHINTYSTKHSEAIISENKTSIATFFEQVDSACVYANASTRFSDGNEFGFGAEIGISTQKIHARGPMGLEALTSYQYQIVGNGNIRK